MRRPPRPPDEDRRLNALRALNILDTPSEERFDRVTRLARRLFDVPMAMISLVDSRRLWIKSTQGIPREEADRDLSFCAHAILDDAPMVVEDTHADDRFLDNPYVTEKPRIRFYAGCPVHAGDGSRVGVLCILDRKPRRLAPADLDLLLDLASSVESELQALELATVDELTGLSNRRGFESIARHTLALSRRVDRPVTLLFLDVDDLKTVNDEDGHLEGDRLIVEVSRLLLETFRDSDVVARIGGDEFCVLLSGVRKQDVERPLGHLRDALAERNMRRGTRRSLTLSLGTATYDPDRHGSITDLINEADRLMYRDKRRSASGDEDAPGFDHPIAD
jgi:diguanylate cyclase (GGDEF)-like protein